MKKLLLVLLALIFFFSCTTTGESLSEKSDPVPYEKEEFPQWSQDLRRGEVILLGSLPLVFMLSNLAYDNMGDQVFSDYSTLSNSEETKRKMAIAFSISGTIALLDYILGFWEKDKK